LKKTGGEYLKTLRMFVSQVLDAFRGTDQKKLRKLNDKIMKEAVLDFTKPIYELAVLSYILSKIVSKPRFLTKNNKPYLTKIEENVRFLLREINSGSEKRIDKAFDKINSSINSLEKVDLRFVRNLVSKGKLKTAATMYAQGISLGLASEMTGMSKQDILDYAGKTMMFDRIKEEMSVKDRLKLARRAIVQ
jgi:hypothetical protein